MAHDDAAHHARRAVHLVEGGGSRAVHHGVKGRKGDLRVVGRPGVAPGQLRRDVLEVGQVHLHGTAVRAHRLHRLVAGGVPDHGKGKPPLAGEGDASAHQGREVGGRDQVHVERPLPLQIQGHGGDLGRLHGLARQALGDRSVLAVAAAKRAAREEDGPAPAAPREHRLLPEMQGASGDDHGVPHAAQPQPPGPPVDPAPAGTQHAAAETVGLRIGRTTHGFQTPSSASRGSRRGHGRARGRGRSRRARRRPRHRTRRSRSRRRTR